MEMILIIVDECGDEVEFDRYHLGDDLDEDYLEMWKSMKIDKAREQYPEARSFYFEDRGTMQKGINMLLHDMFGDCGYEEDEWDE